MTIKDIARLSGVEKSTVSRVLNNESGVSERTHRYAEMMMQQHGFSPSRSTHAMRGQSSKVMAITITHLDFLSENPAVQTTLPALYGRGYGPIVTESQFSPGLVEKHLGILARRSIDGVILFGFTGISGATFAPWRDTLALMARDVPGFTSVCCDDEGAITLLMQWLYDHGYRHISFLDVPHSDVTTGECRHFAYLALYKKHRLTPTAALPGLGMKQGYDTVANMLAIETSVLAYATDTLASGASKYLQQQDRATLQLASVDSTSLMKFLHPEILTVDPGYVEPGRRAVQQLTEQIVDSVEPRQIVIPAVLNQSHLNDLYDRYQVSGTFPFCKSSEMVRMPSR